MSCDDELLKLSVLLVEGSVQLVDILLGHVVRHVNPEPSKLFLDNKVWKCGDSGYRPNYQKSIRHDTSASWNHVI